MLVLLSHKDELIFYMVGLSAVILIIYFIILLFLIGSFSRLLFLYHIYSFYSTSGYFFFKLIGKRNDFCMIDLKDNALYSFDRLFDNFKSNEVNPFVGSDKNHLYMLVREKDLAVHYLNIKCTYPAIRAILPDLSINGNNWILLTIKIKNEI